MPTAKNITTFALALIAPISLLSGYFCLAMPPVAQGTDIPEMSMTVCGEIAQTEHYMAPNDASTGTIALCCVAKKDNPTSGVLNLNEWPPSGADQPIASADVVDTASDNHLIFEDYPISPLQVKLLASVIKIE